MNEEEKTTVTQCDFPCSCIQKVVNENTEVCDYGENNQITVIHTMGQYCPPPNWTVLGMQTIRYPTERLHSSEKPIERERKAGHGCSLQVLLI